MQNEIRKVLRIRWQDDIIMVVDKSLSKEGWKYVKETKKKDYYHKDLELEQEKEETKAFGFKWETRTGVVRVRATNQFEKELKKEEGALRKNPPMVQGNIEFRRLPTRPATSPPPVLKHPCLRCGGINQQLVLLEHLLCRSGCRG